MNNLPDKILHPLINQGRQMHQNDISHRPPRTWVKVRVEVAAPLDEIAASFLGNLSGSGVEHNDCFRPTEKRNTTSSLTAYLDKDERCSAKLESLKHFLANLHEQNPQHMKPKFSSELIVEEDWGNNWKKYFKPIHATERIVIRPSWEVYTPKKNEFVLEIDPGMAFGTGMHASTQLSLEFIDELFREVGPKPSSTLDVGTGTGILGLSAALLGCPHVIGIDNDIDARLAATDNIRKNRLENKMSIVDQDLQDIPDTFDLVIANIIRNTLIDLAQPLVERVARNGFLILAGILAGQQAENIIKTYCTMDLVLIKEIRKEEWSALCLARK